MLPLPIKKLLVNDSQYSKNVTKKNSILRGYV